ncbi:centromere protein K isoform X3 [Ranitomeya variabilis]|uniref:centromere protein K isoform X3 n=1 Tax=Ranitomeya variabilis TaxID=490064 RepID=UPI004057579D
MAGPAVTMDSLDDLLKETELLARHMSVYQQDLPPDLLTSTQLGSEELIQQCEEIWAQIEQYRNQIKVMKPEAEPVSDVQLFQRMMKLNSLQAKLEKWQTITPEILSNNQDILLVAGKEELQNIDRDVEMMLSIVRAENKKMKSDLENAFHELKNKLKNEKAFKEELLSAFGNFLQEQFPLPEEDGRFFKKKKVVSEGPPPQWVTLHVILETLINQLMSTPNDPYIIVKGEYWPPYIELMLRFGIALRHPADAKRIRLEAFHL